MKWKILSLPSPPSFRLIFFMNYHIGLFMIVFDFNFSTVIFDVLRSFVQFCILQFWKSSTTLNVLFYSVRTFVKLSMTSTNLAELFTFFIYIWQARVPDMVAPGTRKYKWRSCTVANSLQYVLLVTHLVTDDTLSDFTTTRSSIIYVQNYPSCPSMSCTKCVFAYQYDFCVFFVYVDVRYFLLNILNYLIQL